MNTEGIRAFKEKIASGAVIGLFSKTSDPMFIEAMGYSGLDYVIIDLEHGPNSVQTVQNLVRAAEISGLFPIVRVKEGHLPVIGEVLDIGAGGIQVPQITCAEDARTVLRAAKFAPDGMRGVCRFVRAADYSSMDRFQYFSEANESVVIMQLEGEEALANLDEIIAVEGIDIVFIGPYDLSQSLGVPGQVDHPIVEEKMKSIIDTCLERGIAVGTFVDTVPNALKWKGLGVRYISYSVDAGLFTDACSGLVKDVMGS